VYTAGGEVLMGTLRWEKEQEEKTRVAQRRAEFVHKRGDLQVVEADTHARITALQLNLEQQRVELAQLSSDNDARIVSSSEREQELGRIRSADPARRPTAPLRAKRDGSNGSNRHKTSGPRSAR
jgi:circadian clock protein KaiC